MCSNGMENDDPPFGKEWAKKFEIAFQPELFVGFKMIQHTKRGNLRSVSPGGLRKIYWKVGSVTVHPGTGPVQLNGRGFHFVLPGGPDAGLETLKHHLPFDLRLSELTCYHWVLHSVHLPSLSHFTRIVRSEHDHTGVTDALTLGPPVTLSFSSALSGMSLHLSASFSEGLFHSPIREGFVFPALMISPDQEGRKEIECSFWWQGQRALELCLPSKLWDRFRCTSLLDTLYILQPLDDEGEFWFPVFSDTFLSSLQLHALTSEETRQEGFCQLMSSMMNFPLSPVLSKQQNDQVLLHRLILCLSATPSCGGSADMIVTLARRFTLGSQALVSPSLFFEAWISTHLISPEQAFDQGYWLLVDVWGVAMMRSLLNKLDTSCLRGTREHRQFHSIKDFYLDPFSFPPSHPHRFHFQGVRQIKLQH